MKRKQRQMLREVLDLWGAAEISRLAAVRRIGAMFETIEADASEPTRKRFAHRDSRLGGCTERLVAA